MREYGPGGQAKEIEPAPKPDTGHARTAVITNAQIKLHEVALALRSLGLREVPATIERFARDLGVPGRCC